MSPDTQTHVEMVAGIVIPLGSGIGYIIWQQAQQTLKVNTMWEWFTNHGSNITGYKKGEKR